MKDNFYKWIAGLMATLLTVMLVAGMSSVRDKVDKDEYYHDQGQISEALREIKQDIKTLLREH